METYAMAISKILEMVIRWIVGLGACAIGFATPGYIASRPLVWFASLEANWVVLGFLLLMSLVGVVLGFLTVWPFVLLCDNAILNVLRGARGFFGEKKIWAPDLPLARPYRWLLTQVVRYRWNNKNYRMHVSGPQDPPSTLVFLTRCRGMALVVHGEIRAFGWVRNVSDFDFDAGIDYYLCAYEFRHGIHHIVLGYISGESRGNSAQRGYVLLAASNFTGRISSRELGTLWYDDTPPSFSVRDHEIYAEILFTNGEQYIQKVDRENGVFVEI